MDPGRHRRAGFLRSHSARASTAWIARPETPDAPPEARAEARFRTLASSPFRMPASDRPSSFASGCGLRELEDRWSQIEVGDERVVGAPGFDLRPADHQWDADRLLVGDTLPSQPVLAEEEAIVRGEDEVGVVKLTLPPQLVHQLSDHLVDCEQALRAAEESAPRGRRDRPGLRPSAPARRSISAPIHPDGI